MGFKHFLKVTECGVGIIICLKHNNFLEGKAIIFLGRPIYLPLLSTARSDGSPPRDFTVKKLLIL